MSFKADYIGARFDERLLGEDVRVSTMSITFRVVNRQIDLAEIAAGCPLSSEGVIYTDYKGVLVAAQDMVMPRAKKRRKQHNFFNSMTLGIADDDRVIHFKLFKNGSVQCAGCKSAASANRTICILLQALSQVLPSLGVSDLKINLINANFRLGFPINRERLYRLFIRLGLNSSFERCKHAGVSVRYTPQDKEKPVSLFVFESGSVVIAGSKNENHIMAGFRFIVDITQRHRADITQTTGSLERAMANPKYANLLVWDTPPPCPKTCRV